MLLASFDPFFISGPWATAIAVAALLAMLGGGLGTIRSGRWAYRALLICGALLWPLPDHPLQGPVVIKLSYLHGIHLADLVSIAAIGVAILPWRRRVSGRRADSMLAAPDGGGHSPGAARQERR